jgi:hypothetical protein
MRNVQPSVIGGTARFMLRPDGRKWWGERPDRDAPYAGIDTPR